MINCIKIKGQCLSGQSSLTGLGGSSSVDITDICAKALYEFSSVDNLGNAYSAQFTTDSQAEVVQIHNYTGSLCFELRDSLNIVNLDSIPRVVNYKITKLTQLV